MKVRASLFATMGLSLLVVACVSAPTPTPLPTPTATPTPSPTPVPEPWTRQFGSSDRDMAKGVAVDGEGNIYVAGWTEGRLSGRRHAGREDGFLRKYDVVGKEVWTRLFGFSGLDEAAGVAVDKERNIYVAGWTEGALPGQASVGDWDAFLRKQNSEGDEVWTRQFGSLGRDVASSVAVDDEGNVYVAGSTWGSLPGHFNAGVWDAFLRKYDQAGEVVWTRQFGSTNLDRATAVVVDGQGNVYTAGWTWDALSGQTNQGIHDAFIRKYDTAGQEVWTRQFGSTEGDMAFSVALDGQGNVYVVGWTDSVLQGQVTLGGRDAFLRKYDGAGDEVWTRQFGSSKLDIAASVFIDGPGKVYVAGWTADTLSGQAGVQNQDVFLRRFNAAGEVLWTHQFGSANVDRVLGLAVGTGGNVYVAGWTDGALPGQISAGSWEAFVARVVE